MLNKRLRAVTFKRLLLFLALTLGALSMLGLGRFKISGLIRGPQKVSAEAFVANPAKYDGRLIKITGEASVDTGLVKVKGAKEKLIWNVIALTIGDKQVAVKSKKDSGFTTVEGIVEQDAELYSRLLTSRFGESIGGANLSNPILKYNIDTTSFSPFGVGILLAIGLLVLALTLKALFSSVLILSDVDRHPVRKSLALTTNAGELAELDGPEGTVPFEKVGRASFFTNWVIFEKKITADVFRFDEILWVYQKRTQSKVYGVIPAGTRYATVVCTRSGTAKEFDMKKATCEQVLATLSQRAPWAFHGYSPEMENYWKNSRDALVQDVYQRAKDLGRAR
jgi:hypothetical protein